MKRGLKSGGSSIFEWKDNERYRIFVVSDSISVDSLREIKRGSIDFERITKCSIHVQKLFFIETIMDHFIPIFQKCLNVILNISNEMGGDDFFNEET